VPNRGARPRRGAARVLLPSSGRDRPPGRQGLLKRLDLVVGGIVILALVTALVGPLLVDWSTYRSNFEEEASRILGQPVRVEGSASARLLPMPTLTFTDVAVGPDADAPVMTVKRFGLRIELMPLLKGIFQVDELVMEEPTLQVAADKQGRINWLVQGDSTPIDPERVVVQRLEVVNGRIDFTDARAGVSFSLTDINTDRVDARSLHGPWRIEGNLSVNGVRTSFNVATGRRLQSGAIAFSAEIVPAESIFAGRLQADGTLRVASAGPVFDGRYRYEKFGPAPGGGRAGPATVVSFHSEGKFNLTPERLRISDFALARGFGDLSDVTGALTVTFGARPRFDAVVTARQVNLDGAAGQGPEARASVSDAARDFAGLISQVPLPPIPGSIGIDIPAVVIGGGLIQNLRLDAVARDNVWSIEGMSVELPGRTRVSADALLTPGAEVSLVADLKIASEFPAALASWYQGSKEARPIAAFDFAAGIRVTSDALNAENIVVRMGGATARGSARWARSGSGERSSLDLAADKLDLVSLLGVAESLGGGTLPRMTVFPDEFVVRIAADTVIARHATLEQVAIDLSREADRVTVNRLSVGNLAGAKLETQGGEITGISDRPSGRIETVLTAEHLDGLTQLAGAIAPDSGLTQWLRRAGGDLAPVQLTAVLAAPGDGTADYTLSLDGRLGLTDVRSRVSLAGKPWEWRAGVVSAEAEFMSEQSAALGRQAGLDLMPIERSGAGKIRVRFDGVPKDGAATSISGELAGLAFVVDGESTALPEGGMRFDGTIEGRTQDLDPVLMLFGRPPSLEGSGAFAMSGTLTGTNEGVKAAITRGTVAGQSFRGEVELAPQASGWRLGGRIDLDTLDLTWLGELALGVRPYPVGGGERVWPEVPLTRPAFAGLSGTVEVSAGRLAVGTTVDIANARLGLSVQPDLLGIVLRSGTVAGGSVKGNVEIRNPSGDAAVTGDFEITGGSLGELVWRREDRPVASGRFDARADFEATGRTIAALVGSVSGEGTFAIRDGELRYVNLAAFDTILDASQAGRVFEADELRDLFRSHFDSSTLPVRELGGTFRIAAGKVRAANLHLESADGTSRGDATIDLNNLTVESGWAVTAADKDESIGGAAPRVEVVFLGPLSAPERRLNVSQLAEYLTLKTLQREQMLHEKMLAEQRERERLAKRRADGLAAAVRAARDEAAWRATVGLAALRAAQEEAERKAAEAEAAARKAAEEEAARKAAEAARAAERQKAEAERQGPGVGPGAPIDLLPQ
jgi:uncharacterized protein involved in outer membrane biogenesis